MAYASTCMLGYLGLVLINQAETVLRQASQKHIDNDAWARSLLQQAIQISSHLMQSTLRQRALHDLVEVATLFDGAGEPAEQSPAAHSYTPVMSGGATRHGGKTRRRTETINRPAEEAAIYLQSGLSEPGGRVTQNEDNLELPLVEHHHKLRR